MRIPPWPAPWRTQRRDDSGPDVARATAPGKRAREGRRNRRRFEERVSIRELQVTVVYVPVFQQAFGTVGLSAGDWLQCLAIASSVLWLREIGSSFSRNTPGCSPWTSSTACGPGCSFRERWHDDAVIAAPSPMHRKSIALCATPPAAATGQPSGNPKSVLRRPLQLADPLPGRKQLDQACDDPRQAAPVLKDADRDGGCFRHTRRKYTSGVVSVYVARMMVFIGRSHMLEDRRDFIRLTGRRPAPVRSGRTRSGVPTYDVCHRLR